MIGQGNNDLIAEREGTEEFTPNHRRHHRHRIRVRQKIKVKSGNPRVKKKIKKYATYVVWVILVLLFIFSIYILIEELSKTPGSPLKDRRNKSEIIIKESQINNLFLS